MAKRTRSAGGKRRQPSLPDSAKRPATPAENGEAMTAAKSVLDDLMRGRVSLGSILQLSADEIAKLVDLGKGFGTVGRWQDAARIFAGLTAVEPKVASFHQLLGMAYEGMGDLDAAERAYTEAISRLAAAAPPTPTPGATAPAGDDLFAAYLARGLLRSRRGDKTAAIIDLDLAREHVSGRDPLLMGELDKAYRGCVAALTREAVFGRAS
ncbi:MAG: tetratricopeptide repeat protein [Deltaproteobacteria bacterium]|nr:tetratricopeptide repeat protein [Deltaproteobacteria bacterium]